jgi:hypothetical protein
MIPHDKGMSTRPPKYASLRQTLSIGRQYVGTVGAVWAECMSAKVKNLDKNLGREPTLPLFRDATARAK